MLNGHIGPEWVAGSAIRHSDRAGRALTLISNQEPCQPECRAAPHNIDAEQALLGAILINNEAHDRVSDFLEPHHFFDPLHQQIFETAAKLIASGKRATPITLQTFFENAHPIDGNTTVPQYLGRLATNAVTTVNARDYGQIIFDLAMRRHLIVFGEDTVNAAYDGPVDAPPRYQIEAARLRLDGLAGLLVNDGCSDLEFANASSIDTSSAYVIKGLVPSEAVGAIWGATTAGKTFLLIDACFAVALEKPFMGRRTRRGATLYVALEGRAGFGKRLKAAIGHHGDPGHLFARFKNVVSLGRSPKADADAARIVAAAKLLAKQAGTQVTLIVIDTLAAALAGDNENEAGAIGAVIAQANRIAAATGASVLLAHHPGKDQDRGMRGSYALAAGVDVVIKIEREPGAPVRDVILEKSKDGEEGPIGSFTLEPIVLGRDDDGDYITSCVVKYIEVIRDKLPKRPAEHTAAGRALGEFEHLIIDGRASPSRGNARIPDGASLIKRADWQAACLAKGLSNGEPENEKRTFRRAQDHLIAQGLIGAFGDVVWPIVSRTKKRLSRVHGASFATDSHGQIPQPQF